MIFFIALWLLLCLLGGLNHGLPGIGLATGVMAVLLPFWLVGMAVDSGYDAHCDYSYSDC